MKSFFIRLGSSIVIALIYVSMFFWRNTYYFNVVLATIGAVAAYEYCHATKTYESKFLMIPSIVYVAASLIFGYTTILTFVYIVLCFAFLVLNYEKTQLLNLLSVALMIPLITVSLSCMLLLKTSTSYFAYTLPLCLAASITDVFCYLFGITLGKHKLAPKVSPNKSIEGAVGGTIVTAIVFVFYAAFVNNHLGLEINLALSFVVGIIYAVLAQLGDLSESAIKRYYGIKDFGNLIPGHGGVLDRIDSWIFTTPLVLYIATLIGGIPHV